MKIKQISPHVLALAGKSLTTDQVDKLIAELAEARATMQPEVPRDNPLDKDKFRFHADPTLAIRKMTSDHFMLAIRHPGHAWLVYKIASLGAKGVADYIATSLKDKGGAAPVDDVVPDDSAKH